MMKYKGILKMNKDNIYDFVIDENFKKRCQRIYISTILCLIQILFFSYYVFTSNAWTILLFDIRISTFYLPPIFITFPLIYENIILMRKYGSKSFKEISIIENSLMGKNFLGNNISIEKPLILDWDFYIKKHWFIYDNDPILKVSFIKLSENNKILLIPHSKSNMNFIKKLKEISHS